jgi:hypothetical protein
MNHHLWAHSIFFWIMAVLVGGFFALIFVVFPAVMFIVALVEKMTIHRLVPPQPQDRIPPSPPLEAALKWGFTLVGQFSDEEKRWKRSLISLALSADCLTFLLVVHRRLGGTFHLITRYSGQRWLITGADGTSSDLSGLEMYETLRGEMDFDILLRHHLSRIQLSQEIPIAFTAASLPADIHEHDQARVDAMVRMGFARYVNPNRSRWKRTLRAAVRIISDFYGTILNVQNEMRRAQARKAELEWERKNQADQFLVNEPPAPVMPVAPSLPDSPRK